MQGNGAFDEMASETPTVKDMRCQLVSDIPYTRSECARKNAPCEVGTHVRLVWDLRREKAVVQVVARQEGDASTVKLTDEDGARRLAEGRVDDDLWKAMNGAVRSCGYIDEA